MVGPFVFFDQMGPALLRGGRGLDVRPHPHIGLATVTYLFDGEIMHRDSLGSVRAPVDVHSDMFYVDLVLQPGGRFRVPAEHVERAAYVVEGQVRVGGENGAVFGTEKLIVFAPAAEVVLEAAGGAARLMLFGGEPLDGPRHLWWNFVSSSSDRIERAKADWVAGRFAPVPGETEFIPLPQSPPKPVGSP